MKKISYLVILMVLLGVTACKIDSYDLPEETLTGKLIDQDGEQLITEQPNGFKIRMLEDGATQYYDFWGKADGTFRNTKIFKAKYSIMPFEGPFFPVDPVEVFISGTVNVDFEVIPYCKIDADIVQEGSKLNATFSVKKAPAAGKIKNAQFLVTKWNPNVGMYCKDKNVELDLSGTDDDDIQSQQYTIELPDYIEPGITYYARVAVLCDNDLGRYNLSKVTKIVVE